MLQQFSWTQFLISFAALSALWYLGLLFSVYRKEAAAFLSGRQRVDRFVELAEQKGQSSSGGELEQALMGKSRMPEGLETVSMSAINFSPNQTGIDTEDLRSDQLGLIPDVLEELKEIFSVLSREDGTKKDFIALIGLITEKYGPIGSNPNIGQINAFIRERAPFAISMEELEDLWD